MGCGGSKEDVATKNTVTTKAKSLNTASAIIVEDTITKEEEVSVTEKIAEAETIEEEEIEKGEEPEPEPADCVSENNAEGPVLAPLDVKGITGSNGVETTEDGSFSPRKDEEHVSSGYEKPKDEEFNKDGSGEEGEKVAEEKEEGNGAHVEEITVVGS